MNLISRTTPYFTKATKKMPPLGIVVHNTVTQGLVAPHPAGSWHFEVDRSGDVHQYVSVDGKGIDYAWHVRACDEWRPDWMRWRDSRVSEANSCTVGIELVSYAGNTAGVGVPVAYTDPQYGATRELLAHLYAMYGPLPVVSHGSMQLDRTDPVGFDYARAGLVWKGDGYRYEAGQEAEDMARTQELETALAQANGITTELQSQVDALHEEVAVRTQERDALQGLVDTFGPRIAEMEEALRQAVALAAKRPTRVEVVLGDTGRMAFIPEAA